MNEFPFRGRYFGMGGVFSGKKRLPKVFVDIESGQPTDAADTAIFNEFTTTVTDRAPSIFERFSNYRDGQALASAALTNPGVESRDRAWQVILPNVLLQMEVYVFAQDLSDQFIKLIDVFLQELMKGHLTVFEDKSALTKCFADCFDNILKFDEIKMTLPNLVNDLAYFRRNAVHYNEESQLDDQIAMSNSSTIFWGSPTPMLSRVIKDLSARYSPGKDMDEFEKMLALLGGVSDVCTSMLVHHRFVRDEMNKLLVRGIVGAVLIYDHLSPQGAFVKKKAKFHVKDGMEALVHFEPKQTMLINAIKYSSKHLNDPTSDPKLKALLG